MPNLEIVPSIRLHAGDLDRIKILYPSLGYNKAIREIVRKHLDKSESPLPPVDVDISINIEGEENL